MGGPAITLHGVEVRYVASQVDPVTVGAASVVGLVGTAADAAGSRAASATIGAGNSAIRFVADEAGEAGNGIRVRIVAGQADGALSVAVEGRTVTVTLAATAEGEPASTALEVVTAFNADADASALATASNPGTGADNARPTAAFSLSGGQDEPFPMNTPALVNNSSRIALLGEAGTLAAAVRDVWRTSGRHGATVVAVRVAAGQDAAATLANVVGSRVAKTGIYALLDAESGTSKRPTILAAPGHTEIHSAAAALESVGNALGALSVVDCPRGASIDVSGAVAYASKFSAAYVVYPGVLVSADGGQAEIRPPSGLVAGHIARVDAGEGWHNSPSNRQISDVLGAAPAVDWEIDNPNSSANLLNQGFVTTVIRRQGGVFLWGNRLADGTLITHHRVSRIISSSIAAYVADWIDRNVDLPFIDFILGRLNSFLRDQTVRGVLTGGEARFDPAKNTEASLGRNEITFSVELGIANVAERIVIEQRISDVFNERIIEEAAGRVAA